MLERILDLIPKKEKIQYEKPPVNMTVKLPLSKYTYNGDKYFRYGMHTDMLGIFVQTLRKLRPEISGQLLVQARVIDEESWERLMDHPAYEFFYYRREGRLNTRDRKEVARILMPRSSNITAKQVKKYLNLEFTPESLKKQIGFGVGWYEADFLKRKSDDERDFDSLGPLLGAVNEFKIGSNSLSPALVRMVGIRMMLKFENEAGMVAKSVRDSVSDEVLRQSSKIFRV